MVSPRTGRPKSENPKSTQLAVRLDGETLNKLDALTALYGVSRVEVLRMGIERLYSEQVKKK